MQLDTSRNLEEGKVKRKARPLVDLRLHKDFPFVLFDNRLDDRKAQAGPSEGARARLVGCIEPLEDPLEIVCRNAGAPVGDPKQDALFLGLNFNLSSLRPTTITPRILPN